MPQTRPIALAALLLAGWMATPAHAAESYDNCTGFVESVPAVIATQGVWCLRRDLGTALSDGSAITVAANNVTIDCNGFKLGGLAAGVGTGAVGISSERIGTTIRNCSIRGFRNAIYTAGSGHLIEDNLAELSTGAGMFINSENTLVRDNRIFDTGAQTIPGSIRIGLSLQGEGSAAIGNTIIGVTSSVSSVDVYGIFFSGRVIAIRDNRIANVASSNGGEYGIATNTAVMTVLEGNLVQNFTVGPGTGIAVNSGGTQRPVCIGNRVRGFNTATIAGCIDGGGNYGS